MTRRALPFSWLIPLLLIAPGVAAAGGGSNIASAPKVVAATREVGNTALNYNEFWLLPLRTGDKVRIVWGSAANAVSDLAIYPPGTTDKNHDQTPSVLHDINWKMDPQLASALEPAKPGIYVLQFWCGAVCKKAGPYFFTAFVAHKALLYAPTLTRIGVTGKLKVFVRTPDGRPITDPGFVVRLYGTWKDASYAPASRHVLAKASPVGGVAVLGFELPSKLGGRSILLQVVGGGKAYQPASSRQQTVRVGA
jgi:hypothetical protein